VEARDVRGDCEDAIARADLTEGVAQELRELLSGQFFANTADSAVQSHGLQCKPLARVRWGCATGKARSLLRELVSSFW
jgi:hypothetical protein